MLKYMDLVDAKYNEERLLETLWSWRHAQVKLTFAPKLDDRPVEMVMLSPEMGAKKERTIQEVHKIYWVPLKVSNDKTMLVPSSFVRLTIRPNGDQSELACWYRWLNTAGKSVIPKINDDDWCEPIRAAFDEDFSVRYDQWLEAQERSH